MRALIVSGIFAAASLPWSAYAQETRPPGQEFGFDVVYQLSQKVKFDGGSTVDLNDDLGATLWWGWRFNEHLDLQAAIDWSNVSYDANFQSGTFPGVSAKVSGDIETFVPKVVLNYNILKGPLTPFLNVGMGWAFVDTNIPNSRVQVGCWWDPWWGYICTPYQSTKSFDEFTYQVGAGVRWDINKSYALRLVYEKHWLDYSKASSTPDFDQFRLGMAFMF
ncbi:outer membrane beta-barrel protein [Peristeroidobacter soli]|uniref:outer membrane beta-barrel protein n=1 Tax=Peristeroidobacter soli TaxID=2497877 RepID=UPI00101CCABB|nr:outer membrane beta-barrel protein [Peristeroidobacter soli]